MVHFLSPKSRRWGWGGRTFPAPPKKQKQKKLTCMTLKLCWTPQASPPLPLPLLILSPGSKMSQGEGNFVRSCSFETLLRLEMKVDSGSVSYHSQQQQNLSGMTTYLGIRDKVTGKTRLTSHCLLLWSNLIPGWLRPTLSCYDQMLFIPKPRIPHF